MLLEVIPQKYPDCHATHNAIKVKWCRNLAVTEQEKLALIRARTERQPSNNHTPAGLPHLAPAEW